MKKLICIWIPVFALSAALAQTTEENVHEKNHNRMADRLARGLSLEFLETFYRTTDEGVIKTTVFVILGRERNASIRSDVTAYLRTQRACKVIETWMEEDGISSMVIRMDGLTPGYILYKPGTRSGNLLMISTLVERYPVLLFPEISHDYSFKTL